MKDLVYNEVVDDVNKDVNNINKNKNKTVRTQEAPYYYHFNHITNTSPSRQTPFLDSSRRLRSPSYLPAPFLPPVVVRQLGHLVANRACSRRHILSTLPWQQHS